MSIPTNQQVRAYFEAILDIAHTHFPSVVLTVQVSGIRDNRKHFECRAYSDGISAARESLTDAISALIDKSHPSSKAEDLRAQAAELIAKAEAMDASRDILNPL